MSHDTQNTVSTGSLPGPDVVEAVLDEAYERFRDLDEGTVIEGVPALADAEPDLFGVALMDSDGAEHIRGDARHQFSIQSISKAFAYALVCQEIGHDAVLERVGVDNTGVPFDSVLAIEHNEGHPMNPMVNAGAIAATGLAPGDSSAERWDFLLHGLSRFAGRELEIDEAVYRSESRSNQRNQGLALLLEGHGRLSGDALGVVDVYTKQCSLLVDARDLAVMGATLASGGVNPRTGEQVVDASIARDTVSVLASTGMYERSGEWLFEVGAPAKSGISGGIVMVSPGKGAVGAFSPRLDDAGNSVRGRKVSAHLSRALGLDVFASRPPSDLPSEGPRVRRR
ncbi:glutaminase A [Oerskovia flava]|uniref:glutaminase A n=1 Tax=Oerskovia flava TaxID=2986422 RepID=UPI00223F301F|nr:glutaminase A [Oerskovia sp. JB1-3-2]